MTTLTYTIGLTNNREGILERTRFVKVTADDAAVALQKAWESPDGLAFMFVHCRLFPRKSAWVQAVSK